MMDWYQEGWSVNGWGMNGWWAMLAMVLVSALIIGLIIWAIARMTRSGSPGSVSTESARAILDRRFAAGEINAEEYTRARQVMT